MGTIGMNCRVMLTAIAANHTRRVLNVVEQERKANRPVQQTGKYCAQFNCDRIVCAASRGRHNRLTGICRPLVCMYAAPPNRHGT